MMRTELVLFTTLAAACGGGKDHPVDGVGAPVCGDGVKNGTELCDGDDLGGATCAAATASGWVGALSCTSTCEFNVAGCNPPQTTWNTFTDTSNWATFDVSSLFPGAKGFVSTVFDGRYLYFLPSNNGAEDGIVAKYDTQASFGSSGSWETFDVASVNGGAKGFEGGAFDGRYLYLIPYNNTAGYDGVFARYDTHATFGAASSWTTFDLATVDPNARGFIRGTFDGRYIYFGPHYNGAYHGTTARYDTQGAGFADPTAWTTYDLTTLNTNARGFLDVRFDGRYVYYVPYTNGTTQSGLVVRYDTRSADGFNNPASWKMFDIATLNANAVGFYGSAFDGRYLYLAQYYNGATMLYDGWVARYDTTIDFTSPQAWASFDLAAVNNNARGFIGVEFDGRYIYLVPHYNQNILFSGVVGRYDTQAPFNAGASWSVFDTSGINAAAKGFQGGGFDGQYIYLTPNNNGAGPTGMIARFKAKSPPWMPLGWNRTFE